MCLDNIIFFFDVLCPFRYFFLADFPCFMCYVFLHESKWLDVQYTWDVAIWKQLQGLSVPWVSKEYLMNFFMQCRIGIKRRKSQNGNKIERTFLP